jgi:hypothetical protein
MCRLLSYAFTVLSYDLILIRILKESLLKNEVAKKKFKKIDGLKIM